MPSTEFLLYIVIILIGFYWLHTKQQTTPEIRYIYKDAPNKNSSNIEQNEIEDKNINIDIHTNNINPSRPPIPPMPVDPLRTFDYKAINDEFTPPFRRSYYDEGHYRFAPGLYPNYTRGHPGRFRKIGMLIAEGVPANDKYKFLLLMGRQKWTGGDYEYFATSSDTDIKLKFYLHTKNREISDGEIIKLHELEGYTFKVKEDKDLSLTYDPYTP